MAEANTASAAGAGHGGIPKDAGGSKPHMEAKPAGRLVNLRNNAEYLALGNKAGVKPGSVATRSVLTTFRYVLRYAIRRALRVAKYAAIGAAVAFVGTGVLGALGSGIAFFAAPSMGMGMGVGITWAMIKFTWRHRPDRFRGGWWSTMSDRAQAGSDPAKDEAEDVDEAEAQRRENLRIRQDVWMRA